MNQPKRALVTLAFALSWASSTPGLAQVEGTVVDDVSNLPVEGAIVTVQATEMRATTNASGVYSLPDVLPGEVTIVAAQRGFYNEAIEPTAPATSVEIRLQAVPAENDPAHVFAAPETCGSCHPTQYNEWRASAMSRGGTNTWVHDIYDGSGTPDGMGGFVYTRDSVYAADNPASECAACHQPLSWIASPGAMSPHTADAPAVHDGVSCVVCHQIADIDLSQPNAPGIFAGVVTMSRPADPLESIIYGVLGDVGFSVSGQMRAAYNPQLRSEICASCHQDANDPDGDHDFEEASSIISEPTYLEWLDSDYADPSSPVFAECIDCHMPTNDATLACNQFLPYERAAGTLRSHTIEGTTARFLENAVTLTMDSDLVGDDLNVAVAIVNDQTGHHVPTGVTIRNMILLVEAFDDEGVPLTHTGTQLVHELGGVGDPSEGYYAGLPGKLYAKQNHGAAGPGTGITFFTDATGITEDNRIPPLATDRTTYTFAVPATLGPVTLRARLIYRRSWRALVDAKQWTEDGHGEAVEDLQAPHFGHLMEEATMSVSLSGDAGAPPLDAGPIDAGLPASDAGVDGDSGMDGGEPIEPPMSDGCGCRIDSPPSDSIPAWPLLFVALFLIRRSRMG